MSQAFGAMIPSSDAIKPCLLVELCFSIRQVLYRDVEYWHSRQA